MVKLVDLSVTEFVEVLGSNAPAPGGGSAAAVTASMGIALTKMVTELTVGKKKFAEFEEEVKEIRENATRLQQELLVAVDKDTEAFNQVSAVFDLPKDTDEEKAVRREAMQAALKVATQSPFDVMVLVKQALEITKQAVGKTNLNAASDLGVAALNLKAGLQGAWLNVLINISGIKDEEFVAQYRKEGESILREGMAIADEVYQEIVAVV